MIDDDRPMQVVSLLEQAQVLMAAMHDEGPSHAHNAKQFNDVAASLLFIECALTHARAADVTPPMNLAEWLDTAETGEEWGNVLLGFFDQLDQARNAE